MRELDNDKETDGSPFGRWGQRYKAGRFRCRAKVTYSALIPHERVQGVVGQSREAKRSESGGASSVIVV
jgi:hypothetical protein